MGQRCGWTRLGEEYRRHPAAANAVGWGRWRSNRLAAPGHANARRLGPTALLQAGRQRWWLALAGFVALCLPFGAMWTDWLNSVANSTGGGLLYSILEVPMLFLPLIVWAGRTR